ncbi:MAG: hypothetical protein F4010_01670 [Cenarchaeum sp. SB0669_bin_11]|nr:hypothetical protein [Cenarchaeum sp. SB0669_bin_11]
MPTLVFGGSGKRGGLTHSSGRCDSPECRMVKCVDGNEMYQPTDFAMEPQVVVEADATQPGAHPETAEKRVLEAFLSGRRSSNDCADEKSRCIHVDLIHEHGLELCRDCYAGSPIPNRGTQYPKAPEYNQFNTIYLFYNRPLPAVSQNRYVVLSYQRYSGSSRGGRWA